MHALGIDVCTAGCAVALVEDGRVLSTRSEPMARGHVERLAPMVAEALERADLPPAGIGVIAVTTGPGSFTGARLGVSFARGFALASGARAVGVTVFEAMAAALDAPRVLIALDGRKDDLFLQMFENGAASAAPRAHPRGTAWRHAPEAGDFLLAGSGKHLLLDAAPETLRARAALAEDGAEAFGPETVAFLGLARAAAGGAPPSPLYLRAPDAKPQAAAG